MHTSLSARWEKYEAEKPAADSNTDFSRKLNSSTGLSLQRYVLGIMLTSITLAANQLLKTVRSGGTKPDAMFIDQHDLQRQTFHCISRSFMRKWHIRLIQPLRAGILQIRLEQMVYTIASRRQS